MVRTGNAIKAGCAAVAALVMTTAVATQAQQRAGQAADDTAVFSADVAIDEQVVDERGYVVETRPPTTYRLTVRRGARGLRSEIEYAPTKLFAKGPLADPRSGYRMEFDGDMTQGRIYDAAGSLVFGLPDGAAAPSADATDTTGLVLVDRDSRTRKHDLVRRFGAALERIGGRDRYLTSEGEVLTETLVEPATMLPVEVNVARGGALEQRTSIAYAPMPGGRWYVARTRSELALPDQAGRRFVSTRTHTNVVAREAR